MDEMWVVIVMLVCITAIMITGILSPDDPSLKKQVNKLEKRVEKLEENKDDKRRTERNE